MQYIIAVTLAALLVAGQACWRVASASHAALFAGHGITFSKVLGFVFSPLTLLGTVLYVVATVMYMFLLSRYHFSTIQGMLVALSLIFSVLIAVVFFHERLSMVNIAGMVLLLVGIWLVNSH